MSYLAIGDYAIEQPSFESLSYLYLGDYVLP